MNHPSREHGFVPFWFWNGKQDKREISRQISLAAESGLQGLAIHAREGNRTEYLSDEWFELVGHACAEAEKHGLKIWIYDEEGYPSGTAGNKIQALNSEYRQKRLGFQYVTAREARAFPNVIRVFRVSALDRPVSPDAVPADDTVLVFHKKYLDSYVDTLDPEVTGHFIRLTHEEYRKRLGRYFGRTITHFYTDDVNLYMEGDNGLPYTNALDDRFRREYGYSLLDRLPALVEDLPGYRQIRIDYYRLLLAMFLSNFVKPLCEWCERNGVKLTGHLRGDEGPLRLSIAQYSSTMPFFEHEHIPGIDDFLLRMPDCRYLKRLQNPRGLYPMVLYKQVASVANQLKGGVCGAESMASCGWGYPLREQNAQLNFETSMGINLITPHFFGYATEGVGKTDHPPSFFFQQPYWKHYRILHDKFSRVCQLAKRGQYGARTLVLYPMSDAWAHVGGASIDPALKPRIKTDGEERLAGFGKQIAELVFFLVQNHISFDFGDEDILAAHAKVRGSEFRIGKMAYDHVVAPSATYRNSTTELVRKFVKNGGNLVPLAARGWKRQLLNQLEPDIQLNGGHSEIAVHPRWLNRKKEFLISSLSPKQETITLPVAYRRYAILDPESGKTLGKATAGKLSLPPFACVYLLPQQAQKAGDTGKLPIKESLFQELGRKHRVKLCNWAIRAEHENVMLLDCCQADGEQQTLSQLRTLPKPPREMTFTFNVPPGAMVRRLLGERLDSYRIRVNGSEVQIDTNYRHPATRCLQSVVLNQLVTVGANDITMCPTDIRPENFYLTGDFGVTLRNQRDLGWHARLCAPARLTLGNLAAQGLPFYWGAVRYATVLRNNPRREMAWIDLGGVDGSIDLFVDGNQVASRLYPPYRVYLGDLKLRAGTRIEILLHNTAQNFFGPHRWDELETAMMHVTGKPFGLHDKFKVKPFGLHSPVSLGPR